MTTEEKREQTIQGLADMLRTSPFQMEFKVKKKPAWQPLKPRGEVYTRKFTEAGWKSYSELHGL